MGLNLHSKLFKGSQVEVCQEFVLEIQSMLHLFQLTTWLFSLNMNCYLHRANIFLHVYFFILYLYFALAHT